MDKHVCKEMQNEELEAIEAIYMDDFINHAKSKKAIAEFTLKLTPLQSMVGEDVHARIDLKVKFTSKYPYDPPLLKLENSKGIPDDQILQLQKELSNMAESFLGEVMVLQLAHHCQSFLHQYNVPTFSFFEQMVANQQKQEEELLQERQKIEKEKKAENKEREQDVIRQVKEELQKREEVLKQERRKRQISQSSPNNSLPQLDSDHMYRATFTCLRSKEKKFTVVTFRNKNEDKKLFCSSCTAHYFHRSCLLNAIDESNGKQMSLCEWKIKWTSMNKKKVHFSESKESDDTLYKQIQSIEQEFYFLKMKVSHKGVLSYHNLDIEQNFNSFTAKLLLDAITGPPLCNYMHDDGLPIVTIQNIAKQIVDIFYYLHAKSVVHRDLNLWNTFVNNNNQVVICGYAIMKRISDICVQLQPEEELDLKFDYRFQYYQNLVKSGKKGDIFNIGLLLLSLFIGSTNHGYPVVLPNNLPPVFMSFLEGCVIPDETQRSTIEQLAKHSFLFDKISSHPTSSEHSNGQHSRRHDGSFSKYNDNVAIPAFMGNFLNVGKSRLLHEFEVIQYLGEGGFGSVVQVRNKLDSNYYAIKRIPLNPKSLLLNKKITREVKLLSRLNHENVVRYYNSWIEAEDIHSSSDTSSVGTSASNNVQTNTNTDVKHTTDGDSLLDMNKFEIPPECISEMSDESSWCDNSMIIDERGDKFAESSSSSSDEDVILKPISKQQQLRKKSSSRFSRSGKGESSEGIIFQMDDSFMQFGDRLDSDEDSSEETYHTPATTTTATTTTTDTSSDTSTVHQYLYIQMEFCERSTLRSTIDEEELYKEPERVWRLFREIVEGLAHVHAQGFIHRDLKPFNIFMASDDRVKIGDFGLATANRTSTADPDPSVNKDGTSLTEERMTGKVGTALYVAPELGNAKSRIRFSQKVDLYSLGIILFEMFYRPLQTGMERVKTLGLLRTENIIFPEDFSPKKFAREQHLISWLLNHNPDNRPTTEELLNSGFLPPKLEDRQLDELLRHTLNQNNSTRYQRLMSSLFTQTVTPVSDQIYDSDCHGKNEVQIIEAARILEHVRKSVANIFNKHGAVFLDLPLLMPKCKIIEQSDTAATFLDQSGLQVCLPYDSRISFARYISRNNICNLRRFYFGKLYRKQKLLGSHPLGLWECSFDIVSDSNTSLIPEAEVISTVYEIIKEFPRLHKCNFYIRLNHLNILKALFLQNGITEPTQNAIYKILESAKSVKDRENSIKQCLLECGFAEHIINKILSYLSIEASYHKAKEILQYLRKTKAEISILAKQAFQDLDRVSKCLQYLGVELPIVICTSLLSNISHYNGIIFQFVAENNRKRKHGGVDILAIGGCYDKLIESMSQYAETSTLPTAVGVSISVEKILYSAIEDNETLDTYPSYLSECDVIVCSLTNTPKIDGLLKVLHELWSAGISATLFSYELNQDYTVEEIQEHCRDNGVNHLVILKDTDLEFVRVRSRDKEWFNEYRVTRKDLCEYLMQKLSNKYDSVKTQESETSLKNVPVNQSSDIFFKFTFVGFDRVLETNRRRKMESIFLHKYKDELQQIFGNKEIQVVIGKLEKSELKSIAGFLELKSTPEEFEHSVQELMSMFQMHGTSVKRICHILQSISSTEVDAVILLYSTVTETYKALI